MAEKKKIIHVIPTLGFGGAERLVFDIAKRLDPDKYDVRVVAMVRGGKMEKAFRDAKVPFTIFYKKGKLGLGVFLKLKKYFKEQNPDIVHTHLFGADVWAGLAAHFSGVRHIVKTEHNLNLSEGLMKKIIKRMTAFVFERMVAISPAVVEYMIDVEKMPKDKIKIIYNGIDIGRFEQKTNNGFSSRPVLINVARLEKQKGHEFLIRTLAGIRDIDWRLELVGDGSLRPVLERQVAGAGLADRVKFLGNREDVPKLLKAADIFVFTPRWEGLGLAALEASAVGLPVLATSVGGLKNIFKDNKTAQLVAYGDEVAAAKAIAWMIGHPEKAMYMARLAQEMVKEKYSLERMVKEYEHLYDTL